MSNIFTKAIDNIRTQRQLTAQNSLLKGLLVKNTILKGRSPATTGLMSGTTIKNGLFEPLVDTRLLIWAKENNWMLGTVIDKIQVECTKEGGEWLPRFVARCNDCKAEYDEAEPEQCENCGGTSFSKPNKKQLKYITQLFDKPNTDEEGRVIKTFIDIIGDLIQYKESIDDYYLECSLNRWGNPAEIFPLSAEQIRIAIDDTTKGLFCPKCYKPDQTYGSNKTHCPECGEELEETKYIQLEGNTKNIVARWNSKSIIHGNSRAWGNRVYGIPKIWSVWAIAQTLKWKEYYDWSSYSQNKMPESFTFFEGMSTMQVNKMVEDILAWKEKNPQVRKNVWLGSDAGKAPTHVQTMFSPKEMMSLETSQFYREAIAIRWGVSMNMLGIQTPGKLGNETETVEASYDTIIEVQRQISEFVNNKIVPLFVYPEPITDWIWSLKSPKKDDLLRDASIKSSLVNSVVALRTSGIYAKLNEQTFEIEIIDQPKPEPPQQPMGADSFMEFMKARTYVDSPNDAPDGVNVQRGERGGYYYEEGGKKPSGKKPTPDTGGEEKPDKEEYSPIGERGERLGGGLIGDVYSYGKNNVVKVIKKNPKDRYGNKIDRDDLIANERRAIKYTESNKNSPFPATIEINNGEFVKEKLYDYKIDDISQENRIVFGEHLITLLKSDFGLHDDVQAMKNKKGELKIFDADGFISMDGEHDKYKDSLAYKINYFISQDLGIGETIHRFCTVKNTIESFKRGVINQTKDFKKSLTPRNIDPDVAIDDLRMIEDDFVKSLIEDYDEAVKGISASGLSKSQRISQIEMLQATTIPKLMKAAESHYLITYMAGLSEEIGMFGEDRKVRFLQQDKNAIEFMKENPKGMFNAITTFGDKDVAKLKEIVENAYKVEGEFDLNKMVKAMDEATGGSRSSLERIARSETTRISNKGRATQWEKYADPDEKEYMWNVGGKGTCPICLAIANGGTATVGKKTYGAYSGNPYTLKELETVTNDFLTHPNCRCTVSRSPKKLRGDS